MAYTDGGPNSKSSTGSFPGNKQFGERKAAGAKEQASPWLLAMHCLKSLAKLTNPARSGVRSYLAQSPLSSECRLARLRITSVTRPFAHSYLF